MLYFYIGLWHYNSTACHAYYDLSLSSTVELTLYMSFRGPKKSKGGTALGQPWFSRMERYHCFHMECTLLLILLLNLLYSNTFNRCIRSPWTQHIYYSWTNIKCTMLFIDTWARIYTYQTAILICLIIKGKVLPRTGYEGPEEENRYSSTLSLTLALDGGGWSTPLPGCFTPGK